MEGEEQQEHKPYGDHSHVRIEKFYLVLSLFVTLFMVLMSSLWTNSPLINTFIGFLPLLITIGVLLFLVDQDFKDIVYWGTPLLMGLLFLIIAGLLNPIFGYPLNVGGLAVINIVLGLVVVLVLILIEGRRIVPPIEEEVDPDKFDEYLLGIEDKCKALNFVIGRVYRSSNGGTDRMRSRIRINKEWYNEFHSLTKNMEENKDEARMLLHKIADRLNTLAHPEKDVFHEKERNLLKRLARDKHGNDKVIDVLIRNDRDPVEHYYVGAVDGVQKLLNVLENY